MSPNQAGTPDGARLPGSQSKAGQGKHLVQISARDIGTSGKRAIPNFLNPGPVRTSLATPIEESGDLSLLIPWDGAIRMEGGTTSSGRGSSHLSPTPNPPSERPIRSGGPHRQAGGACPHQGATLDPTARSAPTTAGQRAKDQRAQEQVLLPRGTRHGFPTQPRHHQGASRPDRSPTEVPGANLHGLGEVLLGALKLLSGSHPELRRVSRTTGGSNQKQIQLPRRPITGRSTHGLPSTSRSSHQQPYTHLTSTGPAVRGHRGRLDRHGGGRRRRRGHPDPDGRREVLRHQLRLASTHGEGEAPSAVPVGDGSSSLGHQAICRAPQRSQIRAFYGPSTPDQSGSGPLQDAQRLPDAGFGI